MLATTPPPPRPVTAVPANGCDLCDPGLILGKQSGGQHNLFAPGAALAVTANGVCYTDTARPCPALPGRARMPLVSALN